MYKFLKEKAIEDRLLFFYGFIGTMPIVQIFGFTAFTLMTLLLLLFIFLGESSHFKISKKTVPFIIISAFMLLSSIICLCSNMSEIWKDLQINNSVWQTCYLLIFIFYCNKARLDKCSYYVKGIYYASVFQMVWGFLQLIIYTISGISINKLLFYDVLGIEIAGYIQTRGNSIALTGLCWNVGNMAPLIVIGYVFSSSIYLKLCFVLFTFISGSRTAILGILTCMGIQLIFFITGKYKKNYKRLIVGITVIFFVFAVLILVQRGIIITIAEKINDMVDTFSIAYLTTQSSSRLHARYWVTVPKITMWNNIINNLFGYGSGCSGYPFVILYNQYADHAWTVECDFINQLWSYGYLGFVLWYLWYGKHVVMSWKIDRRYLLLFAGIWIEGAVYNVTFNWCYMMLLMLFVQIMHKKNIFDLNSSQRK